MGVFVQTAIVKTLKEVDLKQAIQKMGENYSGHNIQEEHCQYLIKESAIMVLFNEGAVLEENQVEELSSALNCEVLSLFIYDGDFWGYDLAENGKVIDRFNVLPDYFEEISEEEMEKLKGNPDIIAKHFNIHSDDIKKYMVYWTDELIEDEEVAYEDDECAYGDCWQMADFMKKLGFPYDF